MNNKINAKTLLGAVIVVILAYLPFYVTKDLKTGGVDKAAIEAIVEDYVKNNAKVIDESMRKYFGMPTLEEEKALYETPSPEDRTDAINENKEALNKLEGAVVLANPKGTINMIEFMDFRCPYCKRNFETMKKLAEDHKDVRWILKPINPMGGTEAAEAIYAANLQNPSKVRALHDAIFADGGHANKTVILNLAKEAGLDPDRIEKDMASETVRDQLNEALVLFGKLGQGGVPGIVIGETFVEGAYPEEVFVEAIEKARNSK